MLSQHLPQAVSKWLSLLALIQFVAVRSASLRYIVALSVAIANEQRVGATRFRSAWNSRVENLHLLRLGLHNSDGVLAIGRRHVVHLVGTLPKVGDRARHTS